MSDPIADPKHSAAKALEYSNPASALERKLRLLKRSITGVSKADSQDVPEFEARYLMAKEEWGEFRSIWDQRDLLQPLLEDTDPFPNKDWTTLYYKLHSEIVAAHGVLLTLKSRAADMKTSKSILPEGSFQRCSRSRTRKDPNSHILWGPPTMDSSVDTFRSMVHDHPRLAKVEKFHYLLAALKGSAAALVSKLPISDDCYDQAWEKVVKAYDNPRILARMLVHRIADCEVTSAKNECQRYERFLTGVADSIEAFNALQIESPCEFVLSTLALRALDADTRKQFELSRDSSTDLPKTSEVIQFVRQRKLALMMSQDVQGPTSRSSTPTRFYSNSRNGRANRDPVPGRTVSFHTACESEHPSTSRLRAYSKSLGPLPRCPFCTGPHYCARCERFAKIPLDQRIAKIRSWSACFNCLRNGHSASDCRSKFRCRICRRSHHTSIHEAYEPSKLEEAARGHEGTSGSRDKEKSFTGFGSAPRTSSSSTVLLGTVQTLIRGQHGDFHPARALLDSGSQHTFVTSHLAKQIGAKISPSKVSITSIAGSHLPSHVVKGMAHYTLRSRTGEKEFEVTTLVLDHITSELPSIALPVSLTSKLSELPFADNQFGDPRSIDIFIGGDIFHQIITGASIPSEINGLSLIPTSFGLVVTGTLSDSPTSSHHSFFIEGDESVEAQMKAFWEIEEPRSADRTRPDDALCEEFFMKTHSRAPDGRYVVRLPLRTDIAVGDNRTTAYRRFYALEGKLRKDPSLHAGYSNFIKEYLELGHMTPATNPSSYLIPHHGVWQEGVRGEAKLRVVFDASCASSSSYSLNDTLLSGQKLQEDLCNVLTRFRLYAIPLCADIVKMYRQVQVHHADRHLQHILWRDSPSEAVQEFELNTVTYGLKSSAHQALRVIRQLVKDEGSSYPLAASRALTDMYVDDIVSGADSLEEALNLRWQLRELFAKGGFSLGKWASTNAALLPVPTETVESRSIQLDDTTKVLGLVWSSQIDSFSYKVKNPISGAVTKRSMLSSIARIFDPLGFLAPVVFVAKSLIQDVWKAKTDWDDKLPEPLYRTWTELSAEWSIPLSAISIPRCVTHPHASRRLVGFCDASNKGYSATLYPHSEDEDGATMVSLIKAKTKVAPLKFTSIPRLELCGAVLLSRLISSIPQSVSTRVSCFSDSQVVLSWLRTPVHELKVFEANRVDQILSVVPAHRWQHVSSEDNPADLASRGCSPKILKESHIWWFGPDWLQAPATSWSGPDDNAETASFLSTGLTNNLGDEWISRFSSKNTLIRTVVRILRLARRKHASTSSSDTISAQEFNEAELRCARLVQRSHFPQLLFRDHPAFPKEYTQLSPFLDDQGILRVGGRLQNAPLDFSNKHPILLPPKSHFAQLVVDNNHRSQFHAGPSWTLALLRGKYWIPKAAKFIRGRIIRCTRCRISKAKPSAPFMSSLPRERFSQFRAFLQVGVDYAGPFQIKSSNRRNAALGKAYLCLFVCFASKALHLELVSSLSASAFLDALDRFIARRGVPNTLWSDHGTNFIGASRFIKEVFALQSSIEPEVAKHLAPRGINWRFIPPRAPHFGGLWEVGVKSVKGLLTTSIGRQPFTFEELTTILARIEFLLNSRPLCPLTEDAKNCEFLTPGHLLIGTHLGLLPDAPAPNGYTYTPLPRWKTIRSQIESIWARWRKEDLHSLQLRAKWTRNQPNVRSGDLVFLLEKRPAFGQWPVGRIVSTHPGRDGITRVVDVLLPSGKTLTRAVTSLVPLFHHEAEDRSGSSSQPPSTLV